MHLHLIFYLKDICLRQQLLFSLNLFALAKKFNRLYLLGSLYASAWKFLRKEFPDAHCDSFDQKHDLKSKLLEQRPGFLGLKGSRFFALETLVDSLGEKQAC